MLSLFISAFVAGSKRKIEEEVDATQAAPKRVRLQSQDLTDLSKEDIVERLVSS